MQVRAIHKLESERGASIFMALLLFLVCTVVASVAISAATAVSGRYSQLKDMERSYYNVTSAARLFWDEMTKDPDGLTVSITRGCNAEKNAEEEWYGWYLLIDGASKETVNSSTATVFQIATYDLVMNSTSSSPSFTDASREVKQETIKASFTDSEASVPKPKPVSIKKATYSTFTFQAEQGSNQFEKIYVTVKRNDDETFDFEFKEQSESTYVCTLTALVWADGGVLDRSADGSHLEGVTTVTWKPINMTVGIIGDAS